MTITLTRSIQLEEMVCGKCSVNFAMPVEMYKRCLSQGDTFYCPNGHPRVFVESEVDRLRKKTERLKREAEAAREQARTERQRREMAERRTAAQKGVVTKLKKRSAAGVCPCCGRTFQQLARHMQNKHPDFVTEQGIKLSGEEVILSKA